MGNNLVPHARKAMATDSFGNTYVTGSVEVGGQSDYRTEKFDASGQRVWSVDYDGPAHDDDFAHALAIDPDGNVVVTGQSWSGTSNDFATLKYSGATGEPMWHAGPDGASRYNGPDDGADAAFAIAIDPEGYVYVTGYSDGISTSRDFATVKYWLSSGGQVWSGAGVDAGGAVRHDRAGGFDAAYDIALDAAGDVIVVGQSGGAYATIKYLGESGAAAWSGGAVVGGAAIYEQPSNSNIATSVAVDAAGDVFVTGQSGIPGGQSVFATLKYAGATGAPLWSGPGIDGGAAIYDGPGPGYDFAGDLAIDSAGDVIVTGESGGVSDYDYATIKYAGGSGGEVWVARYDGPAGAGDYAHAVVVDADDNLLVTGESIGTDGSLDVATLKYAGVDGAPMWSGAGITAGAVRHASPVGGRDVGFAVALDGDGGVRVAGTQRGPVDDDFGILSYDAATAAQRWVAAEAPGSFGQMLGAGFGRSERALVVDAAGNTYMTGTLLRDDMFVQADFLTQKYDPDGNLAWSVTYDGPAGSFDAARAIALDPDGNVVVTGTSLDTAFTAAFATLKYSAVDGSPMWSGPGIVGGAVRYSPVGTDNSVVALAIDAGGDVFVTGVSHSLETGGDYAVLKYSGATGAPLWSGGAIVDGAARYDREGRNDWPVALVVDAAGNVVVAGYSGDIGSGADYATIKYSGATGATMWSGDAIVDGAVLYDGPIGGDDILRGVALDAAGDVFVTGESASAPARGASVLEADLATLKYSGTTGAPAWSGGDIVDGAARFSSNGRLVGAGVAVDADGDIFVTGTRHGDPVAIATLKYSGGTGTAMWRGDAVVDGAAIFGDADGTMNTVRSLAVDGAGDVVIVGWHGMVDDLDFVTLKYSGDDARLVAVHYFDGGDGWRDIAQAVAVAPDGSLRVAGDATTLGTERMTVVALRVPPDLIFADGFEPPDVPRVQTAAAGQAAVPRD